MRVRRAPASVPIVIMDAIARQLPEAGRQSVSFVTRENLHKVKARF